MIQNLQCQHTGLEVSGIEISGSHKLDKDFVLSRITTKLHQPTTWDELTEDQHRLNRFNGVQFTIVEVDTLENNTIKIRYDLVGQKTIKPIIGAGLIEGNYWFRLGAVEHNLNRKNQTLLGFYASQDGRSNGKLYFENPFYKGKNWGFWLDAFHTASFEPLFFGDKIADYKYDLTGLGIGGINHFGLLDKLSYSLTYFNERYQLVSADPEIQGAPASLTQNKLLYSLGYLHDKLKYDFFYRTGYQHQLLLQSVTTFGEDLPFYSVIYEARHYWKIKKKTNIAGQLRLAFSTNNETPFAPFVLDSNFNLRGVGNRVDRATGQIILNLEVRQTIYRNKNIAFQFVAFSDTGTWRQPGMPLDVLSKRENIRSFVGGGFRFILTRVFDSVIRVDYGVEVFDPEQRGIVLGFGQFF